MEQRQLGEALGYRAPRKLFRLKLTLVSAESEPTDAGIVPVKLLPSQKISSRNGLSLNTSGNVPLRQQKLQLNLVRFRSSLNSSGTMLRGGR